MEVEYVELSLGGRKVKAAAWPQPGHVDDSVTIYLGYGRERAGKVGNGAGFNAYAIRTSAALWTAGSLDIKKTHGDMFLACTQAHHSMEERKPVRRVTSHVIAEAAGHGDEAKKALAEFDDAMAPPAAAAERRLLYENVPGPNERSERDRRPGGGPETDGRPGPRAGQDRGRLPGAGRRRVRGYR